MKKSIIIYQLPQPWTLLYIRRYLLSYIYSSHDDDHSS